ncbi:MAG TPA: rRNA maturation RNase YbeY [Bacteroidota bacterium]|nr:rRNA maturation RNase YbeY [Bacteroidota bacterium]
MIRIEIFNNHPGRRVRHGEIRKAAAAVLRGEGETDALVRVICTGDSLMKRLNRAWLGHRSTTDVLTFTLESGRGKTLEGEIYVNLDQARRQARDAGVTDRNEIARLVVHGSLHLLGYDDATPPLRRKMAGREDVYLDRLKAG